MADRNFQMKSFNGAGWDNLFPKTKIEQVTGLSGTLSTLETIAKGASRARVFDTVAALDTWLGIAANRATLQVGDNFYIKDLEVPDYWWDGTQKQPLSTEKVVLALASAATDGLLSKEEFARLAGITPHTANPAAPGTASPGTGTTYARGNHVHPHATTATQAQAEAGTATTVLSWTPQRVVQAVRSSILTGLSVAANTAVTATDTVLSAIGKLQAQMTANKNAIDVLPIVSASTTAPANTKTGDVWFDLNN